MDYNEEEIRKSLEHLYLSDTGEQDALMSMMETALKNMQQASENEKQKLAYLLDQIDTLNSKKKAVHQEAIEYAVKKTLNHFPEHSGRTTRLMEVSGHGSFTIDLDTGEYLSGNQHLYDDWVEGKIKPPELPEPIKINFKRLAILAFPLILVTGFIITSAVTFVNRNFGALEINEYRFAKPGDKHYKPWTPNGY
jgi:hypothetical protein